MQRRSFAMGLLMLASCVAANGRLETNRFQHERYPYAVFYTPEGTPTAPLGGSWRVENFFVNASGKYAPKRGDAYEAAIDYDLNGDGSGDLRETEYRYDLRLEHAARDAHMWVRTVPVASKDREKALSALAARYVESISGTDTSFDQTIGKKPTALSRRFASRVLHSQPCTLSKREAFQIDFEVANVDQLSLSESARWQRHRIVLVRTGYEHRVKGLGRSATLFADYPIVMVVGLSSRPEEFSELEADFDTLLKRTVLGEVGQGLSMNGESSCGSLAAAETSGGAQDAAPAPEALEENEAAKIPLAPEAMPQAPGLDAQP